MSFLFQGIKFSGLIAQVLVTLSTVVHAQVPTTKPEIRVKSVAIDEIALSYVDMSVVLSVVNAQQVDIEIERLRYFVDINEKNLIDRKLDDPLTLKPGTQDVRIPVRLPFNDVLKEGGFVLLSQGKLDYQVRGFVSIKNFPMQLPFERSGRIDVSGHLNSLNSLPQLDSNKPTLEP